MNTFVGLEIVLIMDLYFCSLNDLPPYRLDSLCRVFYHGFCKLLNDCSGLLLRLQTRARKKQRREQQLSYGLLPLWIYYCLYKSQHQ